MIPVALTIAGSDSGGGAGIQADIKAMQAHGVFAASVITAITAQNTRAVTEAFDLPLSLIEAQLDAVLADISVQAVKTGMLSSAGIIRTVAGNVAGRGLQPLVVDPVMISKSGYHLLREDAISVLREELLPLALLVTPNVHEAGLLAGMEIVTAADAEEAARMIHRMGPRAVLVKGGHLARSENAVDVLFDGREMVRFTGEYIETAHTHGTGCTYAASIAANLARGISLREAVARAKRYVTEAIRHGLAIGGGHGPTDHFYYLRELEIFPLV